MSHRRRDFVPPSARCMRVTIDFASSKDEAPTSRLLIIWLLQQAPIGWGSDPELPESARTLLMCGRFRDQVVSEMRLPASSDGCAEKRIHRGKPAVGPCSLRGRFQ